MTNDHSYYLNLMGIQVWKSRLSPRLDVAHATFTLVANTGPIGTLLLEKLANTAEEQAQIEQLLDAMLAAVKLARDSKPLASSSLQLIMGENLAQQLLATDKSLDEIRLHNPYLQNQQQIFVTYHPWLLLQSPSDKRKAWEDLKKLVSN